jgi:hypothetical protein
MSLSGIGARGVGSFLGVVNLHLCIQPASNFTPSYFLRGMDPVVLAPFAVPFVFNLSAFLRPEAGASITSVSGRSGTALPPWLTFNTASTSLTGLPTGSIRGDYLVDVQFAVAGVAADLLVLVVRVPNSAPTLRSLPQDGLVRHVDVG